MGGAATLGVTGVSPLFNSTKETILKCGDDLLKWADDAVKGLVKLTPDFGRKMEYLFGNATGNKHNIDRSKGMLKQLNSIGIFDNDAGRKVVLDSLSNTFDDASSILLTQADGRIVRESLITGPNGLLKAESVWEGAKLITVKLIGGK